MRNVRWRQLIAFPDVEVMKRDEHDYCCSFINNYFDLSFNVCDYNDCLISSTIIRFHIFLNIQLADNLWQIWANSMYLAGPKMRINFYCFFPIYIFHQLSGAQICFKRMCFILPFITMVSRRNVAFYVLTGAHRNTVERWVNFRLSDDNILQQEIKRFASDAGCFICMLVNTG